MHVSFIIRTIIGVPFCNAGFKWFMYLSRHCLPLCPSMLLLTSTHLMWLRSVDVPDATDFIISFKTFSSSALVHFPICYFKQTRHIGQGKIEKCQQRYKWIDQKYFLSFWVYLFFDLVLKHFPNDEDIVLECVLRSERLRPLCLSKALSHSHWSPHEVEHLLQVSNVSNLSYS